VRVKFFKEDDAPSCIAEYDEYSDAADEIDAIMEDPMQ
jgi:peroxiredoxin